MMSRRCERGWPGWLVAAATAGALAVPWVGARGQWRRAATATTRRRQRQAAVLRVRRPAPGRGREVRRRRRHARLPRAAAARHVRVRQRPADAGAAEHRRRLVHARDRRVAGRARLDQQHVPHQRRAVRQLDRRRSARPSILQAETLAQAAERGGKKVAQIEWAGGRSGAINGPTLDYRNFRSGRGVATNYIAPDGLRGFTRSFGLQFDHPAGFAGNAPFPQAAPDGRDRLDRTCRAPTARPRRCACASSTARHVDKYGLNAYIYDSKQRPQDAL